MHCCILVFKKRKNRVVDVDEDTLYEWMSVNGSGCDYVDSDLTDEEKQDCFESLKHLGKITGNKIKFDEKKLKKYHLTRIQEIKNTADELTFEKYIDWLGAWTLKHAIEPSYTYVYEEGAGVENLDEFLRRCNWNHIWTWYLEDVYDYHC